MSAPMCTTEGDRLAVAPGVPRPLAEGSLSRSVHRCVQSKETKATKLWWAGGVSPSTAINPFKAGTFSVWLLWALLSHAKPSP